MLRAASRDRKLPSVWLRAESAVPQLCHRRLCLRESGEERRGVKEEPPPPLPPPRARAAGRGRSRAPGSRSAETKRRGAPPAPRARHSCPPARPRRAALATPGAVETCGRDSPARPPRASLGSAPAARRASAGLPGSCLGVGYPRASGPLPLLSPYAAGRQLHQNKTPRKVKKKKKTHQNKDENIHLKITRLPEREMFEHVMSNV